MEIVISGRHTEVPERFRRLAEEKLLKIGQLAPKAQRTDVELSHEKNPRQSQKCERVEITVRGSYSALHAYLARLERSPWTMYWWRALLAADVSGVSTMTITIYTLSLDKAWLEV